MDRVRSTALSILTRCSLAEQYSNIALDTAIRRGDFSPADRALLTVLVYGTLERRLTLDHWIATLTEREPSSLDEEVLQCLRLGLYQMAYLDRIPDHAAVNETVALAPRRARGLVNAVLRGFGRRGKQIPPPDAAHFPIQHLSVAYSVGEPLVRALTDAFGFDKTLAMLEAFGKNNAELTLRVNTQRISREELLARLRADGVAAQPTSRSRSGIRIGGAPVTELFGFEEGLFFVQDEASQLAVEALEVSPGMRVLDLCACPGSKSFGIAIEMQDKGELLACDLHANKLSLVRSGAERLGLSVLSTAVGDAREPVAERIGAYDRVLCDVPCSGFGVLGKKPELRYKDPALSLPLPAIQRAILTQGAEYLRVGGRLVYSTCTVLPRENGENLRQALDFLPQLRLLRECALFPDTDGTDGFYFAVLERVTE